MPYSLSRHIDQICDQFEAELVAKSNPRIEDYLKYVAKPDRDQLLRELVALDFDFRRQRQTVDFDEYFKRFPQSVDAIRDLPAELKSVAPDQAETLAALPSKEASPSGSAAPKPPSSRFESLEVAGEGGFATVWKAWDTVMQRTVAVKIPHSMKLGTRDLSEALREAQAASQLRHPNIVFVHEVNERDGVAFIVTDYIDGMNLRECQATGPLNCRQAVKLVTTLARAVQHAHERGVIHRDLKLKNIVVDKNGEPHIADFGLAKREGQPDMLAIQGLVMGTPAYMAPEQARADHSAVDRRTDIYSLGVILFELLTGRTPFHGNEEELLEQARNAPPPHPRSIKPAISIALDLICFKCLNKSAGERYQTAENLADDLDFFLVDKSPRHVRTPWRDRFQRWARRNRSSGATLLASMLTGIGVIAVLWWSSLPAIFKQRVRFETVPRGCKITTVKIDPATGEPDPTKIELATGVTPLTTWLSPGDYLVVAVLSDTRFHEVLRHVPDNTETQKQLAPHRYWLRDKSGVINFRWSIKIPAQDIIHDMVRLPTTDSATPASSELLCSIDSNRWQIPPLFIDRNEILISSLSSDQKWQISGDRFEDALTYAELIGKRLPSSLELEYACHLVHTSQSPDPKINADSIQGLISLPWEWTTSRLARVGSNNSYSPLTDSQLARLALAGAAPITTRGQDGDRKNFPHILSQEGFNLTTHGVRCVRSSYPRTTPERFPRLVAEK